MSATDIIYPRDFFPFSIPNKSDWIAGNYGNSGVILNDFNLSTLIKLYWAAKSMDWDINLGYSYSPAGVGSVVDTGTIIGSGTINLPDSTGFAATIPGGRVVGPASYPIGFSGSTLLPVTVSGSISTVPPATYSYAGAPGGLFSLFYIQWNWFGSIAPWPTPVNENVFCAKGASFSEMYTFFRFYGEFGQFLNDGLYYAASNPPSLGGVQTNLVSLTVDGIVVPSNHVPVTVVQGSSTTTLSGHIKFNFNSFY